jgi:uncharacterized protein
VSRAARTLLVVCGTLSVALGALGAFLPLLPTTPFLLLAAVCYARGSERCHRWLLTNRLFGRYLRDYREGRGVSLRHKVAALALLWMTIGLAAWRVVPSWWGKVLLLGVAVGVTVHLVRMKTAKGQGDRWRPAQDGERGGGRS